jgi:hypothetical protein
VKNNSANFVRYEWQAKVKPEFEKRRQALAEKRALLSGTAEDGAGDGDEHVSEIKDATDPTDPNNDAASKLPESPSHLPPMKRIGLQYVGEEAYHRIPNSMSLHGQELHQHNICLGLRVRHISAGLA